jgi:hypothetical protein
MEPSDRSNAELLLDEYDVRSRVSIVEGVSPRLWDELLRTSDVALHLNNPIRRLSPYLQLSMAAAVPVVVMGYAGGEDVPKDSIFSIQSGMHESYQMQKIFEALAQPGAPRYGVAGREYVEGEHDPKRVASRLAVHLRQAAPLLVGVMKRWEALYAEAQDALLNEVRKLVDAPVPGVPSSYETVVEPCVEEICRLER